MRLTLRTLLAYLDGTLEPAEQDEIRRKLEESPVAGALAQRIGRLLENGSVEAAEQTGLETGLDPVVLAEYLENTLPPHLVLAVEQQCLASEQKLAEVAECHHLLSRFVEGSVDVSSGLQERMCKLFPRVSATLASDQPAPDGAGQRDDWYCRSDSIGAGPHTFNQLMDRARSGDLQPDDLIRLGDQNPWRRAGSLGRLMVLMPFQPPDKGKQDAPASNSSSEVVETPVQVAPTQQERSTDAMPQRFTVPAPRPQPTHRPQFDSSPSTSAYRRFGKIAGGLGLAAAVLLVCGRDYVGWIFLIEAHGKFEEPYHELRLIYSDVEDEVKSNPPVPAWKEFCDETRLRMNSLERGVRGLHSGLEVNTRLINAITELKAAIRTRRPQEARAKLQQALQNLDAAAKMLRL